MSATQVRFFVYENDVLLPLSSLSGQELASIDKCVKDIADLCVSMANMPSKNEFYFHSETLLVENEEEEPVYGLLQCRAHTNSPAAIPKEILANINGKSFKVTPQKLGLSPWGKNVEIKFETI